jgi:hypothetical protein
MIGRDSKDDRETYGYWPWIVGVLFTVGMIWSLFQLAVPVT